MSHAAAFSISSFRSVLCAFLIGASTAPAFGMDDTTATASAADTVDIEPFIRRDVFADIKLSPTAEYLAATLPLEDRTDLVILRRSDNKLMSRVVLVKNAHVREFWWVNAERVVLATDYRSGSRDYLVDTGLLKTIDIRGDYKALFLVSAPGRKIAYVDMDHDMRFVDGLRGDDRHILAIWEHKATHRTGRVIKIDLDTMAKVAEWDTPIRNAAALADDRGAVRFCWGLDKKDRHALYHRSRDDEPWALVATENAAEGRQWPVGFSEDGHQAYLWVERSGGADAIELWTPADGSRRTVYRHTAGDPSALLHQPLTKRLAGVIVADGKPSAHYFNPESQTAQRYRQIAAAFPDKIVNVTSWSDDGRKAMLEVWDDRTPGEFHVYDFDKGNTTHVVSRSTWIDSGKMARMQPFSLQSRDGLTLRGLLTRPASAGTQMKPGPMIVLPHGGPFGIFDAWGYDDEVQLLAAAGYSVLQLNFRGSGGYGRDFKEAGRRQWGRTMQDDLTDATRWAIEKGYADPLRICIYGASYGGYAALMGAVREPDLYRCAVGYVGVYDLPMMLRVGDTQRSEWGENYIEDWIGPPATTAAISPARLADRIKIPVFLAAGGKDERAPIQHTERMEAALRKAGVPVQTLYYAEEGHGFEQISHQREFYRRLLAFFAEHLGGRGSNAAPAASMPAADTETDERRRGRAGSIKR
jgi:dipeptidyl aminopeptidase/acylaminoacyl peptidase